MLFSIIIPAYNVEKYIEDCLVSVCEQDLSTTEYEVIVVDDCSSDETINIIKRLQNKYSNLLLIQHTVNKRQGGARNSALKVAQGDYVLFLDADDCWLYKNTLTIFSEILQENDLTILESVIHKDISPDYSLKCALFNQNLDLRTLSNYDFLTSSYFSSYIWRSAYKRSFLMKNDLFFLEHLMFEDADWRDRSLYCCLGNIGLIKFPFYGYRENPTSTCRKPNKQIFIANIEANIRLVNLLNNNTQLPENVVRSRLSRIKRNVFSFVLISRNYPISESKECFARLRGSNLMNLSQYQLTWIEYLKMIFIKYFSTVTIFSVKILTLLKRTILKWKTK